MGTISVFEIKKGDFNGKTIGTFKGIRVGFGPHYFLELREGAKGRVSFIIGATHHGFKADASEVGGELEKFIYEIREAHPTNKID